MNKLIIIVFAVGFFAIGCTKNKAEQVNDFVFECQDTISYQDVIAPKIINKSCNLSGCHADGAGGKTWSGHQEVSSNADLIYSVISHQPGAKQMPLGGPKLSDSLIATFKCWLDQGALDN